MAAKTYEGECNIIAVIDVTIFDNIVEILVECDAEVVVIYFPNGNVRFEQFIYNVSNVMSPQKKAVEN